MKNLISIFTLIYCTQIFSLLDYDRAIAQSQKGDWQQSKEMLKNVLIEKSDRPDVLYDMGVSSFKSNEPDKALSYFTKAGQSPAATQSLREQAFFNAGNAHVALKQLQEAIDAYDKTLELNPSNKHALHNKEVVKKMLEQQKQEQNKNDQEKKEEDNKDQEKQDQEKEKNQDQDKENSDKNQKSESQDKQDQHDKDSQENKQNNNQQQKKDQQDKEKSAQNKKEQEQKEREQKQADEQNNQENKSNDKNGSGNPGQEKNENNKHPKLSPALARILNEQEKKDAELNKKMIKAMAGTHTGATDGYNCW